MNRTFDTDNSFSVEKNLLILRAAESLMLKM